MCMTTRLPLPYIVALPTTIDFARIMATYVVMPRSPRCTFAPVFSPGNFNAHIVAGRLVSRLP